ncbi:MAG: hypothetical protein D3904_14310 [Candidatus Electrothrix sp. EH2]|nr:hypothetical protein [Candidatus Electrothrix sp. EH2]
MVRLSCRKNESMVQTALVRLIYRRRIHRPKRSKEIRRGGRPLILLADPDRVGCCYGSFMYDDGLAAWIIFVG